MTRARYTFALNEAASLRRMVRNSRAYGGASAIRDESAALEKARSCVRFATMARLQMAD